METSGAFSFQSLEKLSKRYQQIDVNYVPRFGCRNKKERDEFIDLEFDERIRQTMDHILNNFGNGTILIQKFHTKNLWLLSDFLQPDLSCSWRMVQRFLKSNIIWVIVYFIYYKFHSYRKINRYSKKLNSWQWNFDN